MSSKAHFIAVYGQGPTRVHTYILRDIEKLSMNLRYKQACK